MGVRRGCLVGLLGVAIGIITASPIIGAAVAVIAWSLDRFTRRRQ